MWSEDQLKWYDKQDRARPTHISHGINLDDIDKHMKKLQPNSWHLEGNKLTGMTDMGPLTQFIPTDYILEGTDDNGLPKFRKVVI